jgi:hypothetical protein
MIEYWLSFLITWLLNICFDKDLFGFGEATQLVDESSKTTGISNISFSTHTNVSRGRKNKKTSPIYVCRLQNLNSFR